MRIASATLLEVKPPATTILSLSGRIPASGRLPIKYFSRTPRHLGRAGIKKDCANAGPFDLIPVDAAIDLGGRENQEDFQAAAGFQRLYELGLAGRSAMQLRGGQTCLRHGF